MADEPELPTGTVTFLFTDIEESTAHWDRHPEAMAVAQGRAQDLVAGEVHARGGVVFKTTGDGALAAFPDAPSAVETAVAAQRRLRETEWTETGPLRVRMAIHTGTAVPVDGDYLGPPLNRCARILGAAHGGQVLISASAAGLAGGQIPAGTELVDLGAFRLSGLQEPERLFGIGPPGETHSAPHAAPLARSNLPEELSSFVGRADDLGQVLDLLREHRLVTLLGTGGVGKTRLAREAARRLLDDLVDGVWLVELAPVVDPEFVVAAVADDLEIVPKPSESVGVAVLEHLRPRRLLLLLDNCEHVIDGVAPFVLAALQAAPELVVLATSREALNIEGEQRWVVPPLAPAPAGTGPESLLDDPAVRLFGDRAADVRPDFTLDPANVAEVAEICRRLDGIPLAIELAAARVRLLPPAEILARLDDRFALLTAGRRTALPRHQTLRAAVDWSFEMLEEDEAAVFAALSVFAGGFDLDGAEAVTGVGTETVAVLERLVDKSLLGPAGPGRYALLETLRQYGADRSIAAGSAAATAQRHAGYFAGFAEGARPRLRGPDPAWFTRLEAERPNLRKALTWALTPPVDPPLAARIAIALREFWQIRGHWREGQRWLERCLEHAAGLDDVARGRLHHAAGVIAAVLRDYPAALPRLEEARTVLRASGPAGAAADASFDLAQAAVRHGDYDRGEALLVESLEAYEASGVAVGAAEAHCVLAQLAVFRSDLDRAGTHGLEARRRFEELGDVYGLAWSLSVLAERAYAARSLAEAEGLFRETVDTAERIAIPQFVANGLQGLGKVAGARGHPGPSADLLAESLRINRQIGDPLFVAGVVADLAGLAVRRGDPAQAAGLWGLEAEMRRRLGDLPTRQRGGFYDREDEELRRQARRSLGVERYKHLFAEGRTLGLEAAVPAAADPAGGSPPPPAT